MTAPKPATSASVARAGAAGGRQRQGHARPVHPVGTTFGHRDLLWLVDLDTDAGLPAVPLARGSIRAADHFGADGARRIKAKRASAFARRRVVGSPA